MFYISCPVLSRHFQSLTKVQCKWHSSRSSCHSWRSQVFATLLLGTRTAYSKSIRTSICRVSESAGFIRTNQKSPVSSPPWDVVYACHTITLIRIVAFFIFACPNPSQRTIQIWCTLTRGINPNPILRCRITVFEGYLDVVTSYVAILISLNCWYACFGCGQLYTCCFCWHHGWGIGRSCRKMGWWNCWSLCWWNRRWMSW